MKQILYILCGMPFSGKTTLAKKIAQKFNSEIVAFDWIWTEIYPSENPDLKNKDNQWLKVRNSAKERITALLKEGRSVVYDDVNPKYEHREEFRQLGKKLGIETKVIFLDLSFAEIKKRRSVNLINKDRHDVSDQNFNKAIADFEKPTNGENVTFDKDIKI
jgi:predicted kinase